jgi:hypothetical protein
MAKFGSGTVTVYLEGAPGGTSYAIQDYVLEMGGVKITSITEPTTALGDTWEEHLPVGLSRGEPISLTGHFDDTATSGPHAILKDVDDGTTDDTRALVVGFGNTRYFHADTRLTSYEVLPSVGKLTRYSVELLPTGTCTWTTSTS